MLMSINYIYKSYVEDITPYISNLMSNSEFKYTKHDINIKLYKIKKCNKKA